MVALTRLRRFMVFSPILRNSACMYWKIFLYLRKSCFDMNTLMASLCISMYESLLGHEWNIDLSNGLVNPTNFSAWCSLSNWTKSVDTIFPCVLWTKTLVSVKNLRKYIKNGFTCSNSMKSSLHRSGAVDNGILFWWWNSYFLIWRAWWILRHCPPFRNISLRTRICSYCSLSMVGACRIASTSTGYFLGTSSFSVNIFSPLMAPPLFRVSWKNNVEKYINEWRSSTSVSIHARLKGSCKSRSPYRPTKGVVSCTYFVR